MKKSFKTAFSLAATLAVFLYGGDSKGASWQEVLQSRYDIVETFDELRDWTPGGQWYSAAGCPTCPSDTTLPRRLDGTKSIWGLWNNKGLAFQYDPGRGTFAPGDLITGGTSGARATVRQVWNLEGKWYIQLTDGNGVRGTTNFVAGERISCGSKTGSNLQWPLFIADHGPGKTWRGNGKSLVMDIGDNDNTDPRNPTMAGLGAQRMAAFLGDGRSGKSGYKKIHVFFMMKVSRTFFNKSQMSGATSVADGYDPVSVVKVFELDSGFTGVSQWGIPSEAAQVSGPDSHRLNEYGLNYSIFYFMGGGKSFPRSIFFGEGTRVAGGASRNYLVSRKGGIRPLRRGTSLDIESYIASGDWFGVEVASDIGTPGNNDGSLDFWIYDKNGSEKGHYSVRRENRVMHFDHFYNKFVLGGNRLSRSGKTGGNDSRWWIDDVIINGSRIGPSYFLLLKGTTLSTVPSSTPTKGTIPSGQ
ncbi:hypothetical protein LPW11_14695 [Geomonas sp. RF6]|uniref:hypothetical protein n=1 Tax=Geomonas sp. RF6 TaxID=2897342 RepID=UPI001E2D1154|nr:hypothetical protein [Geomonas sp. RF6]UFS69139.1 hypothetical protein LPW11_14695 [Geomonas sp. RF6]